jgi:general stress protein CsbA
MFVLAWWVPPLFLLKPYPRLLATLNNLFQPSRATDIQLNVLLCCARRAAYIAYAACSKVFESGSIYTAYKHTSLLLLLDLCSCVLTFVVFTNENDEWACMQHDMSSEGRAGMSVK